MGNIGNSAILMYNASSQIPVDGRMLSTDAAIIGIIAAVGAVLVIATGLISWRCIVKIRATDTHGFAPLRTSVRSGHSRHSLTRENFNRLLKQYHQAGGGSPNTGDQGTRDTQSGPRKIPPRSWGSTPPPKHRRTSSREDSVSPSGKSTCSTKELVVQSPVSSNVTSTSGGQKKPSSPINIPLNESSPPPIGLRRHMNAASDGVRPESYISPGSKTNHRSILSDFTSPTLYLISPPERLRKSSGSPTGGMVNIPLVGMPARLHDSSPNSSLEEDPIVLSPGGRYHYSRFKRSGAKFFSPKFISPGRSSKTSPLSSPPTSPIEERIEDHASQKPFYFAWPEVEEEVVETTAWSPLLLKVAALEPPRDGITVGENLTKQAKQSSEEAPEEAAKNEPISVDTCEKSDTKVDPVTVDTNNNNSGCKGDSVVKPAIPFEVEHEGQLFPKQLKCTWV